MDIQELVKTWFKKWETGNYLEIPVANNFRHTSPYGTIDGKEAYLKIVEANKDKFLDNQIKIHDEIYEENRACVRYTIIRGDFTMEVSEWLYKGYDLIEEISDDRKLSNLE